MSIDANPSIKEIATTFGDTPPYSMSELYGLNFSSGNAVVSGTISLSGFSNKTVETLLAETNKLTANGRPSRAEFGISLSVSSDGSTLIVGARGVRRTSVDVGSAYIFEQVNGTWTQQAELTSSSTTSNFGNSVYISDDGSTAIVGAPFENSDVGSAYIFEKGSAWSDMTETAKLTASNGAVVRVGTSVSISGDGTTALVAAPFDNGNAGSAYIFEKGSAWSNMTETAELTASDGLSGDQFGYSVSISGNGSTVLVGAIYDDTSKGSGYIFEKGSAWSDMTETAKLTTTDTDIYNYLGISVSISGDGSTAVIGSDMNNYQAGAAYIFEKPGSGWTTTSTHTAKLTTNGGEDFLGVCVAISDDGNTVIAGAKGYSTTSGSAYIFKKPDSGWSDMTETSELTPSDGAGGDRFGLGVCISDDGSKAMVGSPRDDSIDLGSAYVFEPSYFVN